MRRAAPIVLLLMISAALAVLTRLYPEVPVIEFLTNSIIVQALTPLYNYIVHAIKPVIAYLGITAAMMIGDTTFVSVETIQNDKQMAPAVIACLWIATGCLSMLTVWHIQAMRRKDHQLETLQRQVIQLKQEIESMEIEIADLHKTIVITEQPDPVRSLLQNPALRPLLDSRNVDQLAVAISDGATEAVCRLNSLQVGSITGAARRRQPEAKKAALALALLYFYHMTVYDLEMTYNGLRHLMHGPWQAANNRVYSTYNMLPMLEDLDNSITAAGNTQGLARHKYSKVAAFLILGKCLENTHMLGEQNEVGEAGQAA